MRVLLLSLLAACQSSDPPAVDVTPPDSSPAEDSDVWPEDSDAPVHHDLPRCDDPTEGQLVPADVEAWGTGIFLGDNKFYGHAEWDALEALGEEAPGTTPLEQVQNRITRAWYRLHFGEIDRALADLEAALALTQAEDMELRGRVRELLATTWMRKAELDNCVTDGTGEACLVPFSEEALHLQVEGMTNAQQVLGDFLTEDRPTRRVPRWLYNLTHMTLGTWPDEVPGDWLIDPDKFQSEKNFPAWPNVAPHHSLSVPTLAGGAAIEDVNGDGWLDLITSSMEPTVGMRVLLNTGDGHFCDNSVASGLTSAWGILSFTTADYDNDGDVDILAPRAAWMADWGRVRVSLMRNDGDGHFTDVAVEAGLANTTGPTQTAAWADVNLDGWLDVFIGRESDRQADTLDVRSSLYLGSPEGVFTDVGEAWGAADLGFVKGAAFGDYDNDGDADLYVSVLQGPNRLLRNDRNRFTEVTLDLDVAMPREGFATWFFDADQDGWLDIFATAYPTTYAGGGPLSFDYGRSAEPWVNDLLDVDDGASTARMYRNRGATFFDATEQVSLDDTHATMGANFADLNSDGYPDIYLGTGAPEFDALEPNTAYINDGQRFWDVTTAMHTGHLQKGHAVSFGDLDNDGDEDLLAQMGGAFIGDRFPDAVFLNPERGAHAVVLRLQGVTVNRGAVGARVRVVTALRTFHHVVTNGGSFGANSLQIEAALDGASQITRVEVDWPGGPSEVFTAVPADHVVVLREGVGVVSATPFAPSTIEVE